MNSALPPLIQQMLEPAFYPHPVASVNLVQTHGAYVLLTGSHAYKIKKPVDFGFMDYSTLEKRNFYLHEELRLNQRLAPQLYQEVLPISQTGEHYQFGEGTAVEYALQMGEFPQENLLSNLFTQNAVTLAHMENLGKQVALFHQRALVNDHIRSFGKPESAQFPINQNYEQTTARIGSVQNTDHFTQTKAFTDHFFATQTDLLEQRLTQDKIREGHGDLHLGNICLIDDQPVIFDCIEFNEPFRFIDVLSDSAFLVMDLIARERSDLAFRFLNTYLEWTGDWAGLPLLPVFLSYRAYVRAKVTSFLLDDPAVGTEQKEQAAQSARSYYHLAWKFTQPQTPTLYVMQGLSGSGKSTVAKALSLRSPAIHLRSDAVRKHLAKLPLLEKLPPEFYTTASNQQTYSELLRLAEIILAAGFSVVLDAKYEQVAQRAGALALAEKLHIPIKILACSCAQTLLKTRLDQRTGDIADADAALISQQKQAQEAFSAVELAWVIRIDTEQPLVWEQII